MYFIINRHHHHIALCKRLLTLPHQQPWLLLVLRFLPLALHLSSASYSHWHHINISQVYTLKFKWCGDRNYGFEVWSKGLPVCNQRYDNRWAHRKCLIMSIIIMNEWTTTKINVQKNEKRRGKKTEKHPSINICYTCTAVTTTKKQDKERKEKAEHGINIKRNNSKRIYTCKIPTVLAVFSFSCLYL